MLKLSNSLETGESPLANLLLSKLKELHPSGVRIEELSLNAKVGLMILVKTVNHFVDDEELRIMSTLYMTLVGSSTDLRPPEGSTVSLLDQINN